MADDFQTLLGRVRALTRAELLTLDAAVRGLLTLSPITLSDGPVITAIDGRPG